MHILAPHISCVILPHELEEALAQEYKQIYIITSKGFFKHHVLRGEGRFVRVKVDSIPGYTEPKIDQGMNFLPAGKIPYALFEQVQAFFMKVMEVKNSEVEAMIHILYNQERGYHLGVPPQRISKASVSYDWDYVPAGTSIVVDIHSHNTMGAFFSGTDDRDDRNNISFSGVFGKLKDRTPATIWRFNYLDKKFEASVEDLFEAPARPEVAVPEEWLTQVQVLATPVYGGYSGLGNVGRPVGSPASRPVNGKTHEQMSREAKWRYPTTPSSGTTSQNPVAKEVGGNPSTFRGQPSGNGQSTANGFGGERFYEDYDAEDALLHFFGHGATEPGYGVPTRGIPTASNEAEEVTGDDVPFAERGISNTVPRHHANFELLGDDEPADPNFGVNHLREDVNGEEPDPVGKPSGELYLGDGSRFSQEDTSTDPEYEAIAAIHGTDVADAWWDIAHSMSTLDGKDELNQELICDMIGLTTDEGQLKIFREIYQRLSPNNRLKVETHGL